MKCPHCDYHARDKNSLEVHIDRKHQDIAGELSHFCPQCGRGFIHQYSLTNHLYYHKTGHEHTAQARPGPKVIYRIREILKLFIGQNSKWKS